MSTAFVVTTFDVAPYVGRCLASVAACARPGDQVIVVDDGSTDGTDAVARQALDRLAAGVAGDLIALGANTPGGVGTAANIGMDAAARDHLVFVDGDDWMAPGGYAAAMEVARRTGADVTIADYREHHEATGESRRPADRALWSVAAPDVPDRLRALRHIAVPWRKVYRSAFLREAGPRFPEGDFFYEDNPFHWRVCLAAERFAFVPAVIAHHRIGRAGQTMGASGIELTAFFGHYRTIQGALPPAEPALAVEALGWLLENMAWQLGRLSPEAILPYAAAAAECLAEVPGAVWDALPPGDDGTRGCRHRCGGRAAAPGRAGGGGRGAPWAIRRARPRGAARGGGRGRRRREGGAPAGDGPDGRGGVRGPLGARPNEARRVRAPLSLAAYGLAASALAPAFAAATLPAGRGGPTAVPERFGHGAPRLPGPRLWLHAASVGEAAAARGVLASCLAAAPGLNALVTAHTAAGRDAARRWEEPRAEIRLAPWDVPSAQRRLLRAWRPAAHVFVENELWPARLMACARAGVPVLAAGARISERSAARWSRNAPRAIAALLGTIAFLCPQDAASGARLVALGLPPERLGPAETLKAALPPAPALPDAGALAAALPRGRTVLAASTHPGEEALALAAFGIARRARPDLRLILAPRHPRRAAEVAREVRAAGLRPLMRSDGGTQGLHDPGTVYVADTLGELRALYEHAALAFVGGSTTDLGGHTPFEPVAAGCAVVHGPDVANAAEPYGALGAAGGAIRVADADGLAAAFALTDDPAALRAMAARARAALTGPAPVVPGLIAARVAALL